MTGVQTCALPISDLNGLVGSENIEDFVPLNWKDQLIVRLGGEFSATDSIQLRAGYSFGRSPVPDGTLTPLTAVLMEHSISTGAGWQSGRCSVDVAYQWSLPNTQRVGTSDLRAGEYDNSATRIGVHWFGLTTGVKF